ncbi:MAG: glutamate--tRNA ligase [Mycoplasma sp.]|nr:glutamate--tRNA ligase [Mycoplasma sp.]
MKQVRTRYAPSPTGYLHIGGARTALFNYLFAKHYDGSFIFRLEDTDISRNVENGEESQLKNLEWLGIVPDESPLNENSKYGKYRQSEKINRYNEVIDQMLEDGKAYIAFDSSEELEEQRMEQEKNGIASFRYDRNWLQISDEEKDRRLKNNQYSIRVSLPKNKIYSWNDLVRGNIAVNTDEIGDWVIKKSDGYPTYNFAVVIDDHDMEITHVLRGEEHITNTPKQLIIYDLLGWKHPEFGHLTIITNMEGKKLSKRDKTLSQFIEDYKNDGYIPQAIFNFLSLLGWTSEDSKEIMSMNELINKFDYKRLSKSPSKFDITKMNWFAKQYMKNEPNERIINKIHFDSNKNEEWKKLFIDTYKQNCANIKEMQECLNLFNQELGTIKSEDKKNDVINTFINQLKKVDFTIDGIQEAINNTKNITNKNGKDLFLPIRKAATNLEHGPELAKTIYLFGKEKIYKRLEINENKL